MGTLVLTLILCSVVTLNLVATAMAIRSDFGTPRQKALQLVFIWLVPLIGSMLVVWVTTSTGSEYKRRLESGGSGEIGPPGFGADPMGGHHGGHGGVGGDGGHGGH